jgi:hypothetical protein
MSYHFGEVVVQHYNSVLCLSKVTQASQSILLFVNEVRCLFLTLISSSLSLPPSGADSASHLLRNERDLPQQLYHSRLYTSVSRNSQSVQQLLSILDCTLRYNLIFTLIAFFSVLTPFFAGVHPGSVRKDDKI